MNVIALLSKCYQDFIKVLYDKKVIKIKSKELFEEIRIYYKKIGNFKCRAFSNEAVYFNHYGLKHLLYKTRKLRPISDIQRRMLLLPYAIAILKSCKEIYRHEVRSREGLTVYYWEMRKKLNVGNERKILRVVLRKIENGHLHFYSVYDT